MTYKEEIRDLFSVPDDYYLAHCISADFALGKGIAVEFDKRFNMKTILKSHYPHYMFNWQLGRYSADCILEGRVLNLVTKERYFNKPTLDSMTSALDLMRDICEEEGIRKIAMPTIGCGLDRLRWDEVSEIIKEIFEDTDIEILVCKQ